MLDMSPAIVFSVMGLGMLLMLVIMLWLATRSGHSIEQVKQAEANEKQAVKDREESNAQTEIENKRSTNGADALRRLRQRNKTRG